jgi:diguanylate cyclase
MSNSEDIRPMACDRAPVAIVDWDDLLRAVKARLRLLVGERICAPADAPQPDAVTRVQAGVLECVSALDQLHLTLSHDVNRCRELEIEVFELRTALAQARSAAAA